MVQNGPKPMDQNGFGPGRNVENLESDRTKKILKNQENFKYRGPSRI